MSVYEKFCKVMESDTKGTQIAIYSVSGLMLAYAYYRKRPLTRFGKPSDIPSFFITERLTQNGIVKKIETNQYLGTLLLVSHKPPIDIFFTSQKTLPIKISGVSINNNGFSWLQSVLANKNIEFLPISNKSYSIAVECSVMLIEPNKKPLDVAITLLNLGFAEATVSKELNWKDKTLEIYYKTLMAAEKRAQSRRIGVWIRNPPPIWPVRIFRNQMDHLTMSLTPESKRLPEIVR